MVKLPAVHFNGSSQLKERGQGKHGILFGEGAGLISRSHVFRDVVQSRFCVKTNRAVDIKSRGVKVYLEVITKLLISSIFDFLGPPEEEGRIGGRRTIATNSVQKNLLSSQFQIPGMVFPQSGEKIILLCRQKREEPTI